MNNSLFDQIQKALDAVGYRVEKNIFRSYQDTLTLIRNELSRCYEEYAKDGVLTREEMEKYGRLAKLELFIVETINGLTKEQVKQTRSGILDMFQESYYRHAHMIQNDVPVGIDFRLINQEALIAALYNPLDAIRWDERAKDNNELLKKQLRESIVRGLIQGNSYLGIAKDVKEKLNIGTSKAIRIVQTETHRVREEGNLKTMQDAESKGVIMKKRWVSSLSSKTRDTHRKLDGQTVGIDEEFKSKSGRKAQAPGKFGDPAEDINCRCTMISIVDGIEPKLRRARGSDGKNEVIKNTTYEEWQKGLSK